MFIADKVLQEIAYLLSLNDGRLNLLKLMKELYLIDRESINERDSSVSGDLFVSMPHGPALSQTLNLLNEIPVNAWKEYFIKEENKKDFPTIILTKDPNNGWLSQKDKEYIQRISNQFMEYDHYQLEEYTHQLPEWVDPKGSSRRIHFASIMRALNKTDDEITEAKAEYDALQDCMEYQ